MTVHPEHGGRERPPEVAEAPRPRARGWIHRVSLLVAGPAGLFLIAVAPTWGARIAVAIYALSLVTVFWASSTYTEARGTRKSSLDGSAETTRRSSC